MTQTTPSLNLLEAIKSATYKVLQFNGRARRSEFWWTQLTVYLISLAVPQAGWLLILLTIPLTFRRLHDTGRSGWWWGIGALLQVAFFVILVYDIVKTAMGIINPEVFGYSFIITLILKHCIFFIITFGYQILLWILCCLDSEPRENRYGASPKYIEKEE